MKFLKQKLCTVFILMFIVGGINAQVVDSIKIEQPSKKGFYLGIGFGLDYGGIGAKLEYVPIKHFGVFAAAGYNLAKIDWNAGLSYCINPNKATSYKLIAMYGYNGVLDIKGGYADKTIVSHGFTPGVGVDVRLRRGSTLSIELFVPIRSSEFMDEYDRINNDQNYTISQLIPVAFSIGYNFKMN
jgi:hypothetical protein